MIMMELSALNTNAYRQVQLANQTYEMVDKHIRRLDVDLRRFEQVRVVFMALC